MHNAYDNQRMTNLKKRSTCILTAEDKGELKAKYTGSLKKNLIDDSPVNIEDILYVPNLRGNLLSVSSLVKKGHKVNFCDEGAEIIHGSGRKIGYAVHKQKMFIMNVYDGDVSEERVLKTKETTSTKIMWHRRLGHINENYLDQMKRTRMVRGLQYDNNKNLTIRKQEDSKTIFCHSRKRSTNESTRSVSRGFGWTHENNIVGRIVENS